MLRIQKERQKIVRKTTISNFLAWNSRLLERMRNQILDCSWNFLGENEGGYQIHMIMEISQSIKQSKADWQHFDAAFWLIDWLID